jgi:inner membrane protein
VNDLATLQSNLQASFRSRSMGLKLIVVCALALTMTIPALFVFALVQDRKSRAEEVTSEISSHVGGRQTFLGPTLAIPYIVPAKTPGESDRPEIYLVFPTQANAEVKTTTEERQRSLFKVPVFQANMKLEAAFDLTGVPANTLPRDVSLDWNRAELIIGVSDPRGAQNDALLTMGGTTSTMAPTKLSERMSFGDSGRQVGLTLFGAGAGTIAKPGAKFSVTSTLRFSGAQRFALLAYGKTTQVTMQGDWPNPSFDGGFLPVNRSVSGSGFNAEWSVPFIARGVRAEGQSGLINALDATALGVSFVEMADPYQSVNRSLKYVPLFLGLIFLAYFIFEVTSGKRVHPAQYVLVGIPQIIFYLLLLSLAERIGFDFGFLVAGAATVMLFSANARWIFASRAHGVRALVVFSLLYGLIYTLLRLEDNALLVGAIASFLAVAAAMYFTRFIDWYSPLAGSIEQGTPQQTPRSAV